MDVLSKIHSGLTYFDGGTGTLLQQQGLRPGELPETWNILHPERILEVHRAYYRAGSNIINANTFGANSFKFDGHDGRFSLEEVVSAGIKLALQAKSEFDGERYVALDIGPLGKMLSPLGQLPFDEAVERFAGVIRAGAACGPDLILIETMNDSYEAKAAVLAAKENSDLPVFVTVVFDEGGKLMTGANAAAMAAMLEGLRVDAIGMNCSLGPKQMLRLLPELARCTSLPLMVKPNAGLPRVENGRAVYDVEPEEFGELMAEMVRGGARIIGGCCGTTPEYIARTVEATRGLEPRTLTQKRRRVVSSYAHAVELDGDCVLIGERINPTGKKKFREAMLRRDIDYILGEGISQLEQGAQVLDVNVGLPELDEPGMMRACVHALQSVVDAPLQIDTSNPAALEQGLRCYNGKAMINSVNGKAEVMDAVFPLAAKYGGLIVCLTLDENGIPDSAQARLEIARKITRRAADYGIPPWDLIFDPLAMAVSSNSRSAAVTLEAIRLIGSELGGVCSLGVSNISFGLPSRDFVTAAFLTLALQSGLKAAIIDPRSFEVMKACRTFLLLSGRDAGCAKYIDFAGSVSTQQTAAVSPEEADGEGLKGAIVRGLKESAAAIARALLPDSDPMELINGQIIPALDVVGTGFENKTMYLPQLLMSAEAATAAFDVVRTAIPAGDGGAPKVILATVKGDIHDIGKNIVRVLLENYGYQVIDLGRDVAPETVTEAALREGVKLVGLSALMTTTVPAMEQTIKSLRERAPGCRVAVGGAVLTQNYADMIGADAYCKTAMDTVRYADRLFGRG
ncbi:MAG: homocysteine S-methyltransferase family protein [Butyricicoccus sp.]|nr:homocysteine S-methyltransferase family protein [Butyricicoccus sp.]